MLPFLPAPPEGVGQNPTIRKWYVYLTGVAENVQLTEGLTQVSKLQMPVNTDPLVLQQPFKPSPILDAQPLTEVTPTENIWFTDASAKMVNSKWQYKAVALDITTGKQITEEGKGSTQVGQITAIVLAAENEAKIIYVDYAAWAGATQWLCQWETLNWQVNRFPVWRSKDLQILLHIVRKTPFKVVWVKAHAKGNQLATKWNQKVDKLTKIRKITLNLE